MTELVAYRPLTRADFRAEAAFGTAVTEAERMGATACAEIALRPDALAIHNERGASGETSYVVTLDDPIFYAVFGAQCSWWDPDGVLPEADVLEHAQIHFALVELEARRMNGRVAQIVERVASSGADLETTRRAASAKLQDILEQAKVTVRGRAELFDSNVHPFDRVRQRRWFLKVMSELETTDRFARGPQTAAPAPVVASSASPPLAPAAAVRAAPNPPAAVALPQPAPLAPAPPPAAAAPPAGVAPLPAAPTLAPVKAPNGPTSTGAFPD